MSQLMDFDSLRFFDRAEFSAPDQMSFVLLQMLDFARSLAGVPFVISSSFRAGDSGSHGRGLAVDLKCSFSADRYKILEALFRVGFRRIGVYRHHIHCDVDPDLDQGVFWYGSYKEVSDASETDES